LSFQASRRSSTLQNVPFGSNLFGVECPILQSGMGGIAGSQLAAAVSNAGGVGILAGHGISANELRVEISRLRDQTSKPFGVNLILAQDLIHPNTPDPETAGIVNRVLNPLRAAIGLEPKHGLPNEPDAEIFEKIEVILEARVPIFSIGLGNPGPDLVTRCHGNEITVIAMASTLKDAITLEASGVDAVVVQGAEAGGHRSHFEKPADASHGLVGSMVLIPEVVDSIRTPVIAAGGITDGRGLVASLALGAHAAMIGTRFVATIESLATAAYKQAILAGASNETTITDFASGRYARLLKNTFTEATKDSAALPFGWQGSATAELFERSRQLEDQEHMALWAGQSAGRVTQILPAAEVVRQIVQEAEAVLKKISL
jgi:nitronate monooxygenase